MSDEQGGSVIISGVTPGLSKASRVSNSLLQRMADDIVSRANTHKESAERFRVGEYLFREPDYRQITRWSQCFGLTPLELVSILEETRLDLGSDEPESFAIQFEVIDGSITKLCWNFSKLPTLYDDWEHGLRIAVLGFIGAHDELCLSGTNLPHLEKLFCGSCSLRKLALDSLVSLRYLDCSSNYLSDLDLAGVPNLIQLDCGSNLLSSIELRHVPHLCSLDFRMNSVSTVDLAPTSKLTMLNCSRNLITSLDLAHVTMLEELYCNCNRLTELCLRSLPMLRKCIIGCNPLETVNFTELQEKEKGLEGLFDYPERPFFFHGDFCNDDNSSTRSESKNASLPAPEDEVVRLIAANSSEEGMIKALWEYCHWGSDKEYTTSTRWKYLRFTEEQIIKALYQTINGLGST